MEKMKMALGDGIVGAHREVANCVVILSNTLADVRQADGNDASASGPLPDEEADTDVLSNVNEERDESPAE